MTQNLFFFQNNILRTLLLLAAVLGVGSLPAQSARAYKRAGDQAYEKKDYGSALNYYSSVVKKGTHNTALLWKYAESARQLFALDIAAQTYKDLLEADQQKGQYTAAYYHLGQIKRTQGKYDEAIELFEQYIKHAASKDKALIASAQTGIEYCRWAMQQTPSATDQKVEIRHFDKKINSPYSDFAPFPQGDTLYYSSYRFENRSSKSLPKDRITRIMYSINGKPGKEPGRGIPAGDSAHVAHVSLSPDGHFMFFTYCKNLNAQDIRCEIWLTVQDMKGKWTKPTRLPDPINAKGYTTTHPNVAVTGDGHQMRLWFASDRPGGAGKLDIWSSPLDSNWFCPCNSPIDARKPQKLPKFNTPEPVTYVNTPSDDISPFYHTKNNTLYFSSEGWPGFGGFDIFGLQMKEKATQPPVNLGSTINSSYNDLYYSVKRDGFTAYLSSNRPGAIYLDDRNKSCCNDLYELKFPQPQVPPKDETPLISAKSTPKPPDALPILPKAEPPPQVLQDFVGLPLYFDNDEPDKRTRKTTTQQTYEGTVLAYLERQDEYSEALAAGLTEAKSAPIVSASNQFFEEDIRNGYERLNQLCELLLSKLQDEQQIEILIKGFTSPRAETSYNFNLGKRRISSVYNHIESWNDNALQPYLKKGQLSVKETSFGELTAKKGISDDLKDLRNSIFNTDAARERRVEIIEIRSTK